MSSLNAICRKSATYEQRINVPDDKVAWNISWPEYLPNYFTKECVSGCSWADPDIDKPDFKPEWNARDGGIDRRSYEGERVVVYDIVDGYPRNPKGRTGLRGRGRLGRWGPNHAGDALVTRWVRSSDQSKVIDPNTNQPILQFLAIKRQDCGKWAIPGGFVNAYEDPYNALLRELHEEAIEYNTLEYDHKLLMDKFFSTGKEVYKGYVDDPRNTDNSWIETTVYNFHDEVGRISDKIVLDAHDDAVDAKWTDIEDNTEIYATHITILQSVNKLRLQYHFKST